MAEFGYKARAAGYATVSNVAKALSHADFGFTAAELAAARSAVISASSAGVNMLYSGDAPTATFGHPINAGSTIVVLVNENIQALKFIRSGGSDAVVTVTLEA
jgi:hypothetical protein